MTYDRTIPPGLEDAIVSALESSPYRRDAALSRRGLIFWVGQHMGASVPERIVREAIHSLRRKGVLICSAPGAEGGYWLATSREDVDECREREFRAKAFDLLETDAAMDKAARARWGDAVQISLFETMEVQR